MFTYSPALQNTYTKLFEAPARFLGGTLKLSPNTISIFAFLLSMASLVLIMVDMIGISMLVLLISLFFDAMDGSVARIYNKKTKLGFYFELIFDGLHEVLVYPALAYAGYIDWRIAAILVPALILYRVWEWRQPKIFVAGFRRVSVLFGYLFAFEFFAVVAAAWVYFGLMTQVLREVDKRWFIKKEEETR